MKCIYKWITILGLISSLRDGQDYFEQDIELGAWNG